MDNSRRTTLTISAIILGMIALGFIIMMNAPGIVPMFLGCALILMMGAVAIATETTRSRTAMILVGSARRTRKGQTDRINTGR